MLSRTYAPELVKLVEAAAVFTGPGEFELPEVIRAQVAASELRDSAHLRPADAPEGAPDDTDAQLLCDLVTGARRLVEQVRQVELAAASMARERGVTVRQLAQAAGMSERATNDRYRRAAE